MNKRKLTGTRGVVQLWVIGVLAFGLVSAGVVSIKKGFGIFAAEDTAKAKEQAAALVAADERAKAAEAKASELRAAADKAAADLATAKDARHAAVAEDVAGIAYALEKELQPSLNVQAAATLAKSALANSDPVSEARLAAMRAFVDKLTAENVAIRKTAFDALAAKDAELAAARTREASLAASARVLEAQKQAANAEAAAKATELGALVIAHDATSRELKTVGEKLKSFLWWAGVSAALLFGVLWVLPIIAKAHPELGWLTSLAKGAGAVTAYGLHALHTGEARAVAAVRERL